MKRYPSAAGWVALIGLALLTATAPALAEDTLVKTFPFRPGDLLEIDTDHGSIEYRHGGSGEITITVTARRGAIADYLELSFEERDGVRVEGEKVGSSWWSRGDVPIEFVVEGPQQVDLKLATSGGDVMLADVEGEVRVATSGGDIDFGEVRGTVRAATSGGDIEGNFVSEAVSVATSGGNIRLDEAGTTLKAATSGGNIDVGNVGGDLSAATSGGNIKAGDVAGDATAKTSGGNVKMGSIGGELEAGTSGGNIRVDAARGFVSAATSGGGLEVHLDAGNDEGADLRTSGGRLTVYLPPGVGFDLDADASGGRVDSDVSVEVEGSIRDGRMRGTINGGGNTLRLRNNDGNIRIMATGGGRG